MKTPRQPGEKTDATSDSSGSDSDGGGQDAVALLKADHRKVEDLFTQYDAARDAGQKATLAKQICTELIVHTKLEEELFYAACREKEAEHDDLNEAQVEHDTAKVLIAELMSGRPNDEFRDAKVKVLSEYIKHHVGEEEEPSAGIFAKAQEAGVDMSALGQKIQARKSQLLGMESMISRPPSPRSFHYQGEWQHSQERTSMPRYSTMNERDERGRFMSDDRGRSHYRDDDDDRRGSSSRYRERDEDGRFMSDDDRGHSRYGRGGDRDRDDNGRFTRGDDRDYGRSSGSRDRDENGRFMSDDDRHYSRQGRGDRDRDENGRFMSHDERGGMYSSRSRYDDDDDRRGSSSGSRGRDENGRFTSGGRDDDRNGGSRDHGGWFGDSRGHAQAARQGWEHRQSGRDDDDRRYSSRGRDDDDHRGGNGDNRGWHGDPEGHAEAARRGWRHR